MKARRGGYMQFVALAIAWGSSFLLIKVAVEGLSPAQVMVCRLVFGFVVLAAIMLMTNRRWPSGRRTWITIAGSSLFICVAPFTLFAWAGQYIPSGLSAIYNGTAPLATLLVSVVFLRDERITLSRIPGLLVAAGGVVLLLAPWSIETSDASAFTVLAQFACLAANLCFGIGLVISRRLTRTGERDAVSVAASQVGVAAVLGALIAPFIGGLAPVRATPAIVGSLLVLGVISTGLAYVWNARLVAEWGATAASTVTYFTPVVGVVLGIVILNETIHWNEPVGAALVLSGVVLSHRGPRFFRRRPDAPSGAG